MILPRVLRNRRNEPMGDVGLALQTRNEVGTHIHSKQFGREARADDAPRSSLSAADSLPRIKITDDNIAAWNEEVAPGIKYPADDSAPSSTQSADRNDADRRQTTTTKQKPQTNIRS